MNKLGLFQLISAFHSLASPKEIATVYGPYTRQDGRKHVIVHYQDGTHKTISWPKFKLEQHLGHEVGDLTVDHIDSNKTNDSLDNYRLLPRDQHSKEDTRRVQLIDLTCDECGKHFQRSPRLLRDKNKKGVNGVFCGRQCAGRNSRKRQLGLIDAPPTQPFFESTYYKLKNLATFARYFLIKYALK